MPTITPQPVPQKRQTALFQLSTVWRARTINSSPPHVAAPAHIAAPSPPRVSKTSLRLISEEVSLLSGPFSAGILFPLIRCVNLPSWLGRSPASRACLGEYVGKIHRLSPQARGGQLRRALQVVQSLAKSV